jgi:hypothetical protein
MASATAFSSSGVPLIVIVAGPSPLDVTVKLDVAGAPATACDSDR